MVRAVASDGGASPVSPRLTRPARSQSTSDRFNVNQSFSTNWEHLYSKHVGTGHPDITKLCVLPLPPRLERGPGL